MFNKQILKHEIESENNESWYNDKRLTYYFVILRGALKMYSTLEQLTKHPVFYHFAEISKIPRGSGNEKEISDF